MLGSDLIKKIVDSNLVDKEITVIGSMDDLSDVENSGEQIVDIQLVQDLEAGIIIINGSVDS